MTRHTPHVIAYQMKAVQVPFLMQQLRLRRGEEKLRAMQDSPISVLVELVLLMLMLLMLLMLVLPMTLMLPASVPRATAAQQRTSLEHDGGCSAAAAVATSHNTITSR
jgi:hypothetical protein